MDRSLTSHHRDTVEKIFRHPTSANIEWRQVVALLEAIGTVRHERNGKLAVTLGPESEVLTPPHGKDIDIQMVLDLRRMLTQAGFSPDGVPAVPDERSRDHGDSRWGEPS